jgi:hypothetical protein
MLEESKIYANSVVVIDLAQCPGRNQLAHFPDGIGVDERVIDHQNKPALSSLVD